MFGADKVVIEAVGLFARQREHLLCPWRKIIHGFVAHNYSSKPTLKNAILLLFYDFSKPAPGDPGGLARGRLTGLSRSRTMSARSKSRSSAESFSECCFCRCAGCVRMKSSSTRPLSTPGKRPTSTPNLINESRFMVSLDEMLWALARMP